MTYLVSTTKKSNGLDQELGSCWVLDESVKCLVDHAYMRPWGRDAATASASIIQELSKNEWVLVRIANGCPLVRDLFQGMYYMYGVLRSSMCIHTYMHIAYSVYAMFGFATFLADLT